MKAVRKLFLGVIMIVLTVITLTTSTYSWFKINSSANVTGFEFKVTGGEGFMVSLDDKKYTNDLTSSQIKQAILMGYDRDRYVYEDGKLYEVVGSYKNELSDAEINERITNNIQLEPTTSQDGINFYTITGSKISSTNGMVVEFDVYFKAVSSNNDNQRTNIYLLGEDVERDIDSRLIQRTKIQSTAQNNITLLADMKTINGDLHAATATTSADQVTVYSSNALRFSISDDLDTSKNNNTAYIKATTNVDRNLINLEGPTISASLSLTFDATGEKIISAQDTISTASKVIVADNGKALTLINTNTGTRVLLENIGVDSSMVDISNIKISRDAIYELSEDSAYDLGSYATDYKSSEYVADGTLTDLDKLYNSNVNAMYTYYNNRRPYDTLEDKLLKYNDKPVAIRKLVKEQDIINGENPHYIVSVDSGSVSTKLTFRFWLEGWDADCFDGISKSIKVNLSFTSKKISLS